MSEPPIAGTSASSEIRGQRRLMSAINDCGGKGTYEASGELRFVLPRAGPG